MGSYRDGTRGGEYGNTLEKEAPNELLLTRSAGAEVFRLLLLLVESTTVSLTSMSAVSDDVRGVCGPASTNVLSGSGYVFVKV